MSLESIDHIHRGDGLPLGVLSVGDSIANDIFQEYFQNTSGFFVDQARDTLDTTTTRETTDSWFGDSLDVVTEYLSVTLGSSFSQSFSSFTTSRHDVRLLVDDPFGGELSVDDVESLARKSAVMSKAA